MKTRLSSAWSPITVTLMARLSWDTPFDVSTPRESWFFSSLKRFWNQPGKKLLLLQINDIILLLYTRFCADNIFVFCVSLILFLLTLRSFESVGVSMSSLARCKRLTVRYSTPVRFSFLFRCSNTEVIQN